MQHTVHAVRGVRLYASRRAMTMNVDELTSMAIGQGRWYRWLRDTWLRIKCRLTGGHYITSQRWWDGKNFNNGEWHVGCRRCPLFWVKSD